MNDCALTLSVSKTEDGDPPSVTVWYGNGEHDRIRIADASTCGREQRASARVDAKTPTHFFHRPG